MLQGHLVLSNVSLIKAYCSAMHFAPTAHKLGSLCYSPQTQTGKFVLQGLASIQTGTFKSIVLLQVAKSLAFERSIRI